MDQVQKMETVRDLTARLKPMSVCVCLSRILCLFFNCFFLLESDREDGSYCPPVKRERTSSLTQFPPSQSGKCCCNITGEGWDSFLRLFSRSVWLLCSGLPPRQPRTPTFPMDRVRYI